MRPLMLLLFACLCSAFTPTTAELRRGVMIVEFDHLKAKNGIVEVSLFNDDSKFLESGHASFKKRQKVVNGKVRVVFDNIPYGDYAAVSYHDINENKAIDRNFVGIPKEPVAVSRLTEKRYSKPAFNDAKIDFNQPQMLVNMVFVRY